MLSRIQSVASARLTVPPSSFSTRCFAFSRLFSSFFYPRIPTLSAAEEIDTRDSREYPRQEMGESTAELPYKPPPAVKIRSRPESLAKRNSQSSNCRKK
ncbi:hypothetical protein Mapa_011433 [Marchantia paleacea]|nr:hypothetical protein Mapa_011433 [Marchantia paleacea]